MKSSIKNPWKTVKKNIIYTNKYGYTLRDDDVINPKGGTGKYMVLEHRGCACTVALTKDKKVVLVHLWRYPAEEESLEIIAGTVEPKEGKEPFLKSAKRELREEVGGKSNNWTFLGSQWLVVGILKMKSYIFLAQDVELSKESHQEMTENMETQIMDFDEACQWAVENKFQDGQTKLGLLLAKEFLNRK